MISRKTLAGLAVVGGLALALGPASLASAPSELEPAAAPHKQPVEADRLSSAEIAALLDGRAGADLPDNCWIEYSPFTGQCTAVICEVGGIWVILPDDCEMYL